MTQLLRQVILFRDSQSLHELEPLVSAVFQECMQYFRIPGIFNNIEIRRLFPPGVSLPSKSPQPVPQPDSVPSEESWMQAKGRFRNTVDAAKLIAIARQELPIDNDFMLIVTDQEITPPPEWRYKMWSDDQAQHAAVVSFVPMDSRSWGAPRELSDLLTLKQRIRAACLRRVAKWCGLKECERETCYLFRHVESAEALDYFSSIGREHLEEGFQFDPIFDLEFEPSDDPFAVEVLRQQRFRGEAFYA